LSELLTYPAPERNKGPILEVLRRVLPASGTVLEIASGTGQHAVHFAQALPGLQWQPSDPELAHRQAIETRISAARLPNISGPLALNVLDRPWRADPIDAIVCINMIHIAPWEAACALLQEAGSLLHDGGPLFLYGPYLRAGRPTAASNQAFDADLRRRNAQWGLRELGEVEQVARGSGVILTEVVEMTANNLSVVLRKSQ